LKYSSDEEFDLIPVVHHQKKNDEALNKDDDVFVTGFLYFHSLILLETVFEMFGLITS